MSNDSIKKTVIVALGVCLVCSILVSTAAVALKPRQEKNKKLEKMVNILEVGGLYEKGVDVEKVFAEQLEALIIELKSGDVLPKDKYGDMLQPGKYDIKKVAKDAKYGEAIPGKEDKAKIKRKPKYMLVYYVKEGGKRTKLILPVYGKGLWSTMYGFLALDMDLKRVKGYTVYDHGETPGLGGEVENPKWQASWQGKIVFDDNDKLILEVIKGKVDPTGPKAKYRIDGLSGSTLTTRGVDNLLKFWLRESGYGPFFKKIREASSDG
ncbi:MAG: Na(+)-translocating NADH-quinone reductase subunit C [Candidatus Aminicenantes bacterium]|nr:Na(+)-translocating NADH-quinone reductase subunit C [Candidatus Aminicenantes bacterium]